MIKEPRFDNEAPWKRRFQVPVTYGWEIAAQNPGRGWALSNRSGVFQLYGWNVATGNLTQITSKPEGVYQRGAISPDGAFVYYLDDQKGNEQGHLVRVPFSGGPAEDITPYFPLYENAGHAFSHAGNRLGFLTITREGFTLYSIHVAPGGSLGEPEQLFVSENLTTSPSLSAQGEVITIITADQPGTLHSSLLAFDVQSGKQLGRLSDTGASIEDSKFSPLPGDMRLLASSDQSGVKRPLIWNASNGVREDLELAELSGEITAADWSPDGKQLLLRQVWQARQQLYLYDLESRQVTRLQHPHGSVQGEYFSPDGNIYVHIEDATTPLQLVLLDGATGKLKRVVFPVGEFPASRPWRSVSFPSSDGQQIQAWVSEPEGSGPFPTILEIHGGPTSAMLECFHPKAQCWLDAGFAFLSLNYRGSTTFGRVFQEQINGHIGDWELEDMVAARQWLVEQGIARPDQVFLTGWSYGGYLTLFGLGKRPDLWAGGMAGVAFGDYVIAYEDEAEMLKAYDRGLMGGTPQERPEAYRKSSAMTYLEQVRAPLLIIQGHNDTRCPPRSIEVYEKRARELGKDIEVDWFDAGHGSRDTTERIAQQERMLRFAWRIVSARES